MTTFKQKLYAAGRSVKKHSPAIYIGLGVTGFAGTAVLAYKSRAKLEEVIVELEVNKEEGIEVNKTQVIKDVVGAVYLPVALGVASTTCILMAHKIQSNRIKTLMGALVVQQAQNVYFNEKYKAQHGEEAYQKFVTPTKEEVEITELKNGKTKETVKTVKDDIDNSIGQWYDESTEYVSDDHAYNIAYISSVNERLQTLLFQRGSLMLNEVREALGFERIRTGALLGWTTADTFDLERTVTVVNNPVTGELEDNIWVTWTPARYVYEDVEFNGRYSIY